MPEPTSTDRVLGSRIVRSRSLGGGGWTSVHLVELDDGRRVVVKRSNSLDLRIEAAMLDVLADRSNLPTPRVEHVSAGILVMAYVAADSPIDARAERHAADLLADLHTRISPDGTYGLHFDGLIGALPQRNTPCVSWVEFYREHRLLAMMHHAGPNLRSGTVARLERLASRLGEMAPDRPRPSLLHGDVWSGNVLVDHGRIAALIDPAAYYGHAEVELAFIELFSTFGDAFFEQYASAAGWSAADRREYARHRRDLYTVYPLLVHVALFGAGYLGQLEQCLSRLGC
ncbi:MAG: fructosamine kinase family protein [Phycisphaeraceae bacterium]|nr:fructosamine kinase family protein [Phycisphaeraceae bacterium]